MPSSMSEYLEIALLEHSVGHKEFTKPAKVWMGLLTVVPTAASTGASVTEATYTGYARKEIPVAEWNSATGAGPATMKNKAKITFEPCTLGSSKIKAIGLFDKGGAKEGNMLYWAEVTEFEVSVTATPAEAIAEAVEIKLT